MQYGVILPNVGPLAHMDSLAAIALRAEELGYDGIFLSDHVVVPEGLRSAYPYRSDGRFPLTAADRILEPIVALSYLAAVTQHIRLGFSVLVLPYRHPVLNARMLGTLDVISRGRLIAGVGVGWLAEEFAALDADFPHRGAVTDEHIAILRSFWADATGADATEADSAGADTTGADATGADGAGELRGRRYRVAGRRMEPAPIQQPHPPIWTGGTGPPALRRAARLADGWHGVRQSPDDVARVVARIAELRSAAGNNMEGFTSSLRAGLDIIDATLATSDGAARTPMRGSTEQIAGDLAAYARAGLDYLIVEPRAATPEQLIVQLERFAEMPRP